MTDTEKSNSEKLDKSPINNPEGKINQLAYNFLKKYSEKKNVIDTLMRFETSKGIKEFKKQLDGLKNDGKIGEKINAEELFLAIKEASKIAKLTKEKIDYLKLSLVDKKQFFPNKNYDIAEIIKKNNPKLYQAVISPKGFKQQAISAGFGVANSIYKTGAGIKTLGVDTFKLLTFRVPLEQIKQQFKKV